MTKLLYQLTFIEPVFVDEVIPRVMVDIIAGKVDATWSEVRLLKTGVPEEDTLYRVIGVEIATETVPEINCAASTLFLVAAVTIAAKLA